MSMSGDLRFSPRTIRPSRSASAWNLILMASSPQLGDQFRVRVPRMRMLDFGYLLAFGKIGVDLLLIGQIICECAALLRGSMPGNSQPCFPRTSLRGRDKPANPGKHVYRPLDK